MITMYGIPNCDTVKKARVWLDQHGVAYDFHDYKKAGIDATRLGLWVDEHGWETVLNRAGTTILLVEQNAKMALSIADRAYVLETGRVSMSGSAKQLMQDEGVKKAYLGK